MGTYLSIPLGREAVIAGCDTRSEERGVVVRPKRHATLQRARKGASALKKSEVASRYAVPPIEWGFDALARRHYAQRDNEDRASASETRLVGSVEIGSK